MKYPLILASSSPFRQSLLQKFNLPFESFSPEKNAIKQLSLFSANTVTFLTGLCVYDITSNKTKTLIEPFEVVFKALTREQIEAYCDAEQPYNCAGSFKSEGLGICLFEKLNGDDPNSLIGLPLIKLSQLLAEFGIDVLAAQTPQAS